MTAEEERLEEDREHKAYWKRWGPYLSERQWGTVREDYSENGTAWEYFPHDHARSRAYRWGEDGILGISDNHQHLCFALALWNGRDPILKERLFGLTGNQGNHGEDVKEYHFFLDSTPTHSYMKGLYKYPQAPFPYEQLVAENARRTRQDPEYELINTGLFNEDRYFDVQVEYAKAAPDDILIKISATNRGPDAAPLHLLPTLWFRNTWSWKNRPKPSLTLESSPTSSPSAGEDRGGGAAVIRAQHPTLSKRWLIAEKPQEVLFTENETNFQRLYGSPNCSPYVKDGINNYLVQGNPQAVNPAQKGTKASVHYQKTLAPGETWTIKLRLTDQRPPSPPPSPTRGEGVLFNKFPLPNVGEGGGEGGRLPFDQIFEQRQKEADEFYNQIIPSSLNADARNVERQAFAGMLWSKQYYHFIVQQWLDGDPSQPPPPEARKQGRDHDWIHLYTDDIISMPDTWEYPWFAAWDLAFHCIPLAMIDPDFAKQQLLRLTREWYMHPNGQLPAYEWAFGDVNPPVHAWAAWRVYKIEKKMTGRTDDLFLERVFQKLLMNFTWWVNRKDSEGKNIFEGGFLGLDNIGVFDRSKPLPTGGVLEQSDGTSWMAMYCLNLLAIAVELAHRNPAYEDIASKFFEHFLYITDAMRHMAIGSREESLWDEEDGFFYDNLHLPNGQHIRLKIHSLVGLVPLFAIQTLEVSALFKLPDFSRRLNWFMTHRPDLAAEVTCNGAAGACERRLLSIVTPEMLRRILKRMLDENEFLSPYGVRAVSRYHKDHPYIFPYEGGESRVDYEPAESTTGLFGGNSNWRGPIWMPMNFLLLESLQKFHHYLGDDFKVECPTGSGQWMTLQEVATELAHRLMKIFLRDKNGRRAVYGGTEKFQSDPHWKDYVLFYEYFHGDNGAGIGASHQTGWTGLIAKLLQQCGEYCTHHQHTAGSHPATRKNPSIDIAGRFILRGGG